MRLNKKSTVVTQTIALIITNITIYVFRKGSILDTTTLNASTYRHNNNSLGKQWRAA